MSVIEIGSLERARHRADAIRLALRCYHARKLQRGICRQVLSLGRLCRGTGKVETAAELARVAAYHRAKAAQYGRTLGMLIREIRGEP